jgi:RNA polymerase sigma factor (sigma-70 family)
MPMTLISNPIPARTAIRVCYPEEAMVAPESDADLIDRVVRHDERDAFSELVRRHQSQVRAFLRRLTCGDAALADDLAQDAFIRAYLGLKSFRGEARFSTWLMRIACNLFLMQTRKSRRRESTDLPDSGGRQSPAHPSVLPVDLERAMRHLSEAERAALTLCYAHDMSHPEAASVLGCPVGTLKTHVLRGKEKLKKRLAAWKEKVPDGNASS